MADAAEAYGIQTSDPIEMYCKRCGNREGGQ